MLKIVIKIIIEIIVAMFLFYALARYSKVFDRFFEEKTPQTINTENNTAIITSGQQTTSNSEEKKTKYYDNKGREITQAEYLKQFDNEADQMIASISSSSKVIISTEKSSCTTPRSTKVPHGASVTAYLQSQGEGNNYCKSEERTCNDGKLGGSYTNNTCNYTTLSAASATNNLYIGDSRYTQSKQLFRIPYVSAPQEYVQPTLETDRGRSFRTNGQIANGDNTPRSQVVWENNSIKAPYKTPNDWQGNLQYPYVSY